MRILFNYSSSSSDIECEKKTCGYILLNYDRSWSCWSETAHFKAHFKD